MNQHLTEMVFILDRSGSMHGLEADTLGGFNSMLESQRREPGDALVSTVLFNQYSRVIHDRVPIARVPLMPPAEYVPSGSTALLDALGDAIHHIGLIHKYARPRQRPGKTLFVITTDGMENASRRYSLPMIREMILRQRMKYGWEFLFLGANMDAVATAAAYGMDPGRAATFHSDSEGTRANYQAADEVARCIRAGQPVSDDWRSRIR